MAAVVPKELRPYYDERASSTSMLHTRFLFRHRPPVAVAISDDGWAQLRGRGYAVASAVRPAEGRALVDTTAPERTCWDTDIFDEIDNQSVQVDGSSITLGSERSSPDNVEDVIANNRQMALTPDYYLCL